MFIQLLLLSLFIQIALFIPAYIFKTDKLTDFSYSLTFIILTAMLFFNSDQGALKLTLFIMIGVWGLRLGLYLVSRIFKIGRDKRFDQIRTSFFSFLSFWIFQCLVVPLILLPPVFFFSRQGVYSIPTTVGFFIWFIGFLIEAFSDAQKFKFINNPKNKGKWVNVGLWKISRHPNYFGEILCWLGIYIYTYPSLTHTQRLIGLISPVVIVVLLLFISGIPKLEEKADKKWGLDRDYQKYKKRTAVLIPFIY